MELQANIDELVRNVEKIEGKRNENVLRAGFNRAGAEGELKAKEIISTFVNSRGHRQGFDTGHFLNSIGFDPIEGPGEFGFKIYDGVPYGIHHEFGTEAHWLPFFDRNGNLTAFGGWGLRNFDEIGLKVTGKRGKALKKPSRKSKEEVLREVGGMIVKLDEMSPFRKTSQFLEKRIPEILQEEFDNLK